MTITPPRPPAMTLPQFRDALDAALAGSILSDTGASDAMNDLLIEVAVSTPGTAERRAAVKACRAQRRAESA